jgi:hypothetical protein
MVPVRAPSPPRILVLAPSGSDVVLYLGGWLFDWILAGWKATVLTAEPCDDRPLRILGAASGRLVPKAVTLAVRSSSLVAVEATLSEAGPEVGELMNTLAGREGPLVWLWGATCRHHEDDQGQTIRHRPSSAAKAFKIQALSALDLQDRELVDPEELRPAVGRDLAG